MLSLSVVLLLTASAIGDETHALGMAWSDARTVRIDERVFTRWVYSPPYWTERYGNEAVVQMINYNLANLSWRTTNKDKLFAFEDKFGNVMVRWNIKDLALDPDDPKEVDALVKTFEKLQFEPVFNQNLTTDTLKFAAALGLPIPSLEDQPVQEEYEWKKVDVPRYQHDYGDGKKWYNQKWEKTTKKQDKAKTAEVVVFRQFADYLDKQQLGELIDWTQSQAPIISAPYLMARTLRTIKDDKKSKVYATLYGGVYYEASGIPKTEKELLEKLGIGDLKFFNKVQSDRRAWIEESDVTGFERLLEVFPILTRSPSKSGYYMATRDRNRSSIDLSQSARLNLFTFKGDGSEVFFAAPNGLQRAGILNAAREFVEAVPIDLAGDTSRIHTRAIELEAPISCMSCHAKANGFLPIKDQLRQLYATGRLNVIDDLEVGGKIDVDRRIKSWISEDFMAPGGIIKRAQDEYCQAVMAVTGPLKWSRSKPAQLDIAQCANEKIVEMFNAHLYTKIDAIDALAELGMPLKGGTPKDAKAREKMLELAKDRLKFYTAPGGTVVADRRIVDLWDGFRLQRSEFDLIRVFLATEMRKRVVDEEPRAEARRIPYVLPLFGGYWIFAGK